MSIKRTTGFVIFHLLSVCLSLDAQREQLIQSPSNSYYLDYEHMKYNYFIIIDVYQSQNINEQILMS